MNHLNTKQLKFCYSDKFAIQIPAVAKFNYHLFLIFIVFFIALSNSKCHVYFQNFDATFSICTKIVLFLNPMEDLHNAFWGILKTILDFLSNSLTK